MKFSYSLLFLCFVCLTSFARGPEAPEEKRKTAIRIVALSVGVLGIGNFIAFNHRYQNADDDWDNLNQSPAKDVLMYPEDMYTAVKNKRKKSNAGRIISAISGITGCTLFTVSFAF